MKLFTVHLKKKILYLSATVISSFDLLSHLPVMVHSGQMNVCCDTFSVLNLLIKSQF